ncbi:hypothetical protein BROC_00659 [Candidatus Brocadiaceae bacterium]|nr:hypothetical protein BROC_00659 [Candidatus Brocadiaceae bacterium]
MNKSLPVGKLYIGVVLFLVMARILALSVSLVGNYENQLTMRVFMLPPVSLEATCLRPITGSPVSIQTLDWHPLNLPNNNARQLLWRFLSNPDQMRIDEIAFDGYASPDDSYTYLVIACILIRDSWFDESVEYLKHIPGASTWLRHAATRQQGQNNFESAMQLMRLATQLPEAKADTHYMYVSMLRHHGGTREIILGEIEQAVRLSPNNWIYRSALGEVLFELGQYEAAMQTYSVAIELAPSEGSIYFQRGRSFLQLKRISSACADFQTAIDLVPSQRQVYAGAVCQACASLSACQ